MTEAVKDKLAEDKAGNKPWVKLAGGMRHLHKETQRIDRIIEEEFEQVEPEDWL